MADGTPNRGPALLAVNYFFACAAIVCVLLRCYVRLFIVRRFALDDWMMVLALIIFILYAAASNGGVYNGTGQHHKDLEPNQIKRAMNFWWFCYLGYSASMLASKVSIAIFLLRVVVKRSHKWILYAAMVVSIVAGAVFFFVTLFQCHPISYFWDKDQDGKCLNPTIVVILAFVYSVFAVISDLTFVALSAVLVWKLNIRKEAKYSLIPLLSMGGIASAAVVVRFPFLFDLNSPNFLWDTLDTAIWSTVEQGLAISAGSLATIRPLFRVLSEKIRSSQAGTSGLDRGSGYPLSPRSADPSELILTPLQKQGHYTRQKELPSETSGIPGDDDPYGCRVSIRTDKKETTTAANHIVVTTHHSQTVRQQPPLNESEEWLAQREDGTSGTGASMRGTGLESH